MIHLLCGLQPDSSEYPHTYKHNLHVPSCGYALVCLADENCLVADNVLQIIAKYTQDNILRDSPLAEVLLTSLLFQQCSFPTQILLKPEKMAAIVHQFLPNGQVGVRYHRLILCVCLMSRYIIYYSALNGGNLS